MKVKIHNYTYLQSDVLVHLKLGATLLESGYLGYTGEGHKYDLVRQVETEPNRWTLRSRPAAAATVHSLWRRGLIYPTNQYRRRFKLTKKGRRLCSLQ